MLKLKVVLSQDFDDATNTFIEKTVDIELEHSLAALSKWESIWEVPLLSTEKTDEMMISYIECMCLTPDIPREVFEKLTVDQQREISDLLDKKHTATWFSNEPKAKSGEALTAELIYFWMSSFNINWEAQYWNINRLLTLVQVFSVKQDNKPMKQSARSRRDDIMRENARRRKELGTSG